MARTRTLAELRTEVYQRADLENATDFLPSTEVDRYINQSIADLYDLLRDHAAEDYYSETAQPVTTANQVTVSPPTRFFQLLSLERVDGTRVIRMRKLDTRDRDKFSATGPPLFYRLVGGAADTTGEYSALVELFPTPDSAYTLLLRYIPHAPVLNADTDVWDGFNGWEEYVVVDAALKCMEKEQNPDIAPLLARLDRLKERIISLSASWDEQEGRKIHVTDTFDDWYYGLDRRHWEF